MSSVSPCTPFAWRWRIINFVLICLGLTVAFKQAPFYIPDEGAHFLRAYEVSRFHLINYPGSVGVDMPCIEYDVVAKKYHLIAWAQVKSPEEQSVPTCTANTRNTAGAYSFIPYVPAAAAMRISELLGATVEERLMVSRATSFVFWMTLIVFALNRICSGKLLMWCLLLLPSFFWQMAGVSADGSTLASSLIYILIVLGALQAKVEVTRSTLMQMLLTAALLGASKGVYAPLCLFSFALWAQLPNRTVISKLLVLGMPTLGCIITFALFAGIADPSLIFLGNGAAPGLQLQFVLKYPWEYCTTVFLSIWEAMNIGFISPSYAVPNAGRGYGITVFALVSFSVLLSFNAFNVSKAVRAIAALIALIMCVVVCLPLYLTYNPVANSLVLGLQSRYFLPIIPLIFVAFAFDATKLDWIKVRRYALWAPVLPLLGLFLACVNIP